MHSFYFKNFIVAALAVMLCFIFLGAAFIGVGQNVTLHERRETLDGNAQELSRLCSAYTLDGELSDLSLRVVLTAMSRVSGNHCFLCDERGLIVSCSDTEINCGHIGRSVDGQIIEQMSSGSGYSGITSLGELYPDSYYVSARPIVSYEGETLGFVFVGTSAGTIIQVWHSLMGVFLITAVLIMALTLIISYVSAVRQAKPVNEMAAAAVRFAHGDFSARVDVAGDDEVGALAAAFNNMADYLERSEKQRSDFLANVAHELKTPMTTISGFADGILDGTIPPESTGRYLETISSETKRLNRLVRRLLDVSRIQYEGPEQLRRKFFDASELLLQVLIVFEKKINDKQLEVNAQVPEDAIIVLGDADAINQVIYNLLENAIKFAEPGSELGIAIFKQNGKAYISVKNRGATIPPEELPLIFDRFHKTDKSRSMDRDGVGLGLYIVKSILANHGEDIVVTSRDGVTEFVFSLTLK
ncbi:MAG: HAMP domain-containing histidine kinase [Butyricicoccus sp.]|nr:HAMP domain-containing histidine kinase [Butyricicoccus sp.]